MQRLACMAEAEHRIWTAAAKAKYRMQTAAAKAEYRMQTAAAKAKHRIRPTAAINGDLEIQAMRSHLLYMEELFQCQMARMHLTVM